METAAQVPIKGMAEKAMASMVFLSRRELNISTTGLRPPFFAAAFQRSDSGTKKRTSSASTAGLAPTSIIHRQSLTVTCHVSATKAMKRNPKLAAAPIRPASLDR